MQITIKGYTKEVNLIEQGKSYTHFKVGKAHIKINLEGKPYIWIRGKKYPEFVHHIPLIMEFVYEYKRLVSQPSAPAPLSIVDATPDAKYRYKRAVGSKNYVSSVPKWITDLKEWKVCSGPFRTYRRRVRLPQEYRAQVEMYLPFCCACEFRADCEQPCVSPEICSQEELNVG